MACVTFQSVGVMQKLEKKKPKTVFHFLSLKKEPWPQSCMMMKERTQIAPSSIDISISTGRG